MWTLVRRMTFFPNCLKQLKPYNVVSCHLIATCIWCFSLFSSCDGLLLQSLAVWSEISLTFNQVMSQFLCRLTQSLSMDSSEWYEMKMFSQSVDISLQDSDISIRRRALELICALVNVSNVKPLTKELMDYLKVSDPEFKGDLTAKISSLVQK